MSLYKRKLLWKTGCKNDVLELKNSTHVHTGKNKLANISHILSSHTHSDYFSADIVFAKHTG